MRVTVPLLVSAIASAFVLPRPLLAQDNRDAAFLFGYRAKPGMEQEFAAGYGRHLEWHTARNDSLSWPAWTVIMGDRLGMFVDGVFGISLTAMDERVDPRGDAADGAVNITPFADPVFRYVLRARPELSRGSRRGTPSAMQEVAWFRPRPEETHRFEEALRVLAGSGSPVMDFAVYEMQLGAAQPQFMVVVQFDRWDDLADPGRDPVRLILRSDSVVGAQVTSEVWRYRPDLTYRP